MYVWLSKYAVLGLSWPFFWQRKRKNLEAIVSNAGSFQDVPVCMHKKVKRQCCACVGLYGPLRVCLAKRDLSES